ncbi:MAG TPA: MBL fold metallo-hydrolase [Verrucomicrobiae bacterium]|nr:MBL fold metallo-hydrolase [Verrucomicrobiae bacterium]
MIEPVLKDAALLADVKEADRDDGHFRLWWLGQSGFLVQWRGRHLLLDPYLSDSLTKKYAHTDKPHVRMTARAVDPCALDFIDVATSSHNHTDHLDGETLGPLLRANKGIMLVVPEANRKFVAERLGIDAAFPTGLEIGHSIQAGQFRIEAVPARHEELGPEYVGYVVGFGPWTIYHSGDTLLYEGMAERLRPHKIDVALLPINGRAPERRVAGNLSARESAELGKQIGARSVIPCHYEMFEFNTADPRGFAAACDSIGQPYRILRCGERWDSLSL